LEKKNIAITILIVALVASGVGNIVLAILGNPPITPAPSANTLVIATSSGPDTLEHVDAWDSASNDVLEQVVETLFFYDLEDLDLPRINVLAHSYWWVDTTTLQIELKQGILFHDGTPFNAAAAKWNLDRLLYLTNCTGTNPTTVAQTQSLWMFPDGVTPIIDSVATVGTYNITITLNGDYAPFLSTLTYINAGMVSPTAHSATSFIDLTTGHPIGTGPYKYDKYVPGVEVRFKRWDGYWKKPASFPNVIFSLYSDPTTAHNAYLGYSVDWNRMFDDQNLASYEADPKLEVYRFTVDTGKPSLVYQYMGINNQKYNDTMRRAMAYAINYTYVIDVLRLGNALRGYSAISPGFGAAYNDTIESGPYAIDYDVAQARTLMQSMSFGVGWDTTLGGTDEALWAAASFLTVPHTYNTGNAFREKFQVVITNWFNLIGITVLDDGVTFNEFLGYLYDDYDHLGVYAIGWGPDYLDPYNMLDPLFNPASSSNSAQVDDAHLNALMASALSETDEGARNIIYKNIQGYLARMQFHVALYHSLIVYTHGKDIYDVPYNAMGALRLYPIYRGLYPPFNE
jgi:ABC-type transport system substrate-binding protein